MRKPLWTDHQYDSPIVSSDGAYVAVAKGWNWSNPNTAVVIDTSTGKEQRVPISPADALGPIAFVDNSAFGPGYYLTRGETPETLWWCSPNGTQAKQILALPRELHIRIWGNVCVTVDGALILTEGDDQGYGWLHVADAVFEPVIPPSMWPKSVDATTDGNRVVFVDRGRVYEWQRSTAPQTTPGQQAESASQ
jgi:hypothetical protein